MTSVKDLTVEDLLAEGRRWVLYPGSPLQNGVRALAVFEDHPIKIAIGQVSNHRSVPLPPIITAEDPDDWCRQWSIEQGLVKDETDYLMVIVSSIGAQHRCRQVRVIRDTDTGEVWLRDGYGNEMQLDEEHALQLYQDLAEAHDLPFARRCVECGEQLMGDEDCPWCDVQTEDKQKTPRSLKVVNNDDTQQEGDDQ